MKRIIIPTDFSSHSKHTLKYVLNMLSSSLTPFHISLVNTYLVQQTDPRQVIRINDELKKKSKEGLDRELEDAIQLNENPQISVTVIFQMGSLTHVIRQIIQTEKIHLVAMGKDGGKHVEQIEALLREQKCPLLLTYVN